MCTFNIHFHPLWQVHLCSPLVFIHLMQLPSNPIIFGFGWLALGCDFNKTKIQPLTHILLHMQWTIENMWAFHIQPDGTPFGNYYQAKTYVMNLQACGLHAVCYCKVQRTHIWQLPSLQARSHWYGLVQTRYQRSDQWVQTLWQMDLWGVGHCFAWQVTSPCVNCSSCPNFILIELTL